MKPSAIVVTVVGIPKLIDFGLAVEHDRGRDNLTSAGTIIGTPAYMSPEQLLGNPFGPASDVNNGGALPPSQHAPGLPAAFDAFIAHILAADPAVRLADAARAKAEFIAALRPDAGAAPASA